MLLQYCIIGSVLAIRHPVSLSQTLLHRYLEFSCISSSLFSVPDVCSLLGLNCCVDTIYIHMDTKFQQILKPETRNSSPHVNTWNYSYNHNSTDRPKGKVRVLGTRLYQEGAVSSVVKLTRNFDC